MPSPHRIRPSVLAILLATALAALPALADEEPVYIDVEQAKQDPDFLVQGEYLAEAWGAQVVALGDGRFKAYLLRGGLPGDGWNGEGRIELAGERDGDTTQLGGDDLAAEIRDGRMIVRGLEQSELTLSRVQRESPTLGLEPANDAVVLFDGSSADAWNGRMDEQGRLMQGATSERTFEDHFIHIEYLVPFRPHARGQGRGNSGIYMQGRYEVQMLDSFGEEPHDSYNGGIYTVAAPEPNMSYPPLRWQTYDIEFRAARFDDAGNKTENARLTVYHNGVKTHDNVEAPEPTRASPRSDEAGPGPVYLQDHGNPVRYRNIWVIER